MDPTLERPKRDCQCARARHQHGTLQAYTKDRCRCPECTKAAARSYKYRRFYGFDTCVDATAVREHLASLLEVEGITMTQIAEASGVTAPYLSEVMRGRRPNVRLSTQRAILAIKPEHCHERYYRPAWPLTLRLRALCACGWSLGSISRQCGVNIETLRQIVAGTEGSRVSSDTDRRIRDCYERLWDVPPSHDPQALKRTITRTINQAARSGWKRPLDIDETLQELDSSPRRTVAA